MLRNFDISEFDSPDQKGSGSLMQMSTLEMMDRARSLAGVPFQVNSGYRTPQHNLQVGGSATSSHLKGYAADIAVTPLTKSRILRGLIGAGFKRIGIASTFIHADNDPDKNASTWLYSKHS